MRAVRIADRDAERLRLRGFEHFGRGEHGRIGHFEAGELSVVQYLMQQAVLAPSEEARQFAMEYMNDFRSVDFNPNLQLVTLK